jgi:hypothetical protein
VEGELAPGPQVIAVTNVGAQPHHMFMARTPEQVTEEQIGQILELEMQGATPAPDEGLPNPDEFLPVAYVSTLSTGATAWIPVDLERAPTAWSASSPTSRRGCPTPSRGCTRSSRSPARSSGGRTRHDGRARGRRGTSRQPRPRGAEPHDHVPRWSASSTASNGGGASPPATRSGLPATWPC